MVDVVIVNWNSGGHLRRCLKSLSIEGNKANIGRIIIIDNNSSDNSLEYLESFDKVTLVINEQNLGFAYACNQGISASTAPYVLLLNPDTELQDSTLLCCIKEMERIPEADILGAQLLNEDRTVARSCARFPKPGRFLNDAFGLSKIAPAIFLPAIIMTDWDHKESSFVDEVMGAFMFFRQETFKKYGNFDEQFFVYYEELDYCLQLAKAGGKVYYSTQCRAIHKGGGSTENVKAFRLYLNLKSRILFARKNFSGAGLLVTKLCTFLIEPVTRTFFLLFMGKASEIFQVFQAYKLLLFSRSRTPTNQ